MYPSREKKKDTRLVYWIRVFDKGLFDKFYNVRCFTLHAACKYTELFTKSDCVKLHWLGRVGEIVLFFLWKVWWKIMMELQFFAIMYSSRFWTLIILQVKYKFDNLLKNIFFLILSIMFWIFCHEWLISKTWIVSLDVYAWRNYMLSYSLFKFEMLCSDIFTFSHIFVYCSNLLFIDRRFV